MTSNSSANAGSSAACLVCGKESTLRCGGCGQGPICGKECAKENWKTHKNTCAQIDQNFRVRFLNHPTVFGDPAEFEPVSPQYAPEHTELEGGHSFIRSTPVRGTEAKLRFHKVDCSLFVQLMAAAAWETSASGKGTPLGIGRTTSWAALFVLTKGSFKVRNGEEVLEVGYIHPKDEAASDSLQGNVANGGQWVLGPDKKGRYLGMTKSGPMRYTWEQWGDYLLEGLEHELSNPPHEITKHGMVDTEHWKGIVRASLGILKCFKEPWMISRATESMRRM